MEKLRRFLPLIATVVFATILALVMQQVMIKNQEQVNNWLASFGPYLILVYALVQSVTVIIAPLGGSFLQLALFALLKPEQAMALIYLVVTPLYCVNFYIARRYGRPIVQKIVGREGLNAVDHYAKDAGIFTLWILRIFQSSIYDYLSYAIGLTTIPFRTFLIVTVLGGIPGSVVTYLIFAKSPSFSWAIAILYTVSISFAGVAIYINHKIKKHNRNVKL